MKNRGVTALLIGTTLSIPLTALGNEAITINNKSEYHDKKVIAPNIINEYSNLGYQFSNSTRKFLHKHGFSVLSNPEFTPLSEGYNLKLSILNAHSSGNTWLGGHRKSISIEAELYQNGKLIDSFQNARNSRGEYFQNFKVLAAS
ncbi:hypothetical protein ACCI51_02740 [Microbulbifer echini]|uniref:Uncharacterized protein n=1 Tax=Microbulbifer echini TaxID=1529067 RepID=A0ABV4NKQ7_9GAMM|nr:hypothetical protein [uncultured Microbulbifer sp.]